jgi:multiple sugar transport system permease protein
MVSTFVIWVKLGFYDTDVPLWIGSWFGGGIMNIFLVRQYMSSMPYVLNESATIEGAGHFRIYSTIILPNCGPIIATLFVGSFLSIWNDFTGPLIYLKNQWNWTLAIGVSRFGLDGETGGINYLMAACTLMTILPVMMFLFGQKFFIDSIILSGMKE